MSRRDDAPRELLFGLLALQNGMVTRDQLVAAFGAWTATDTPMADLLVKQGALRPEHRPLLDALADAHIKLHGGDPERSLASLDVRRSTRESLARAGGPDVEVSLAQVGSGSTVRDADCTVTLAPTPDVGQRFRVLRFHARGGLGEVFVALDTELNREVALKRIRPERVDDPPSRARFLLEAEVTGHLEHPGVVPVYGLGDDGTWGPFYVMRLIKGETLKQAVDLFHQLDRQGNRDPGERVLALRQLLSQFVDVCNAVGYAHSRGVLHRDIKPGNVMLGPFGETLVVDWGLAKVVGGRDTADQTGVAEVTFQPPSGGSGETQPGSAIGSPAYMSPEQAAGEFDRIGPASDIYSLGATLYYLLAGQPPFQDADIGRVLRDVQRGAFPRPGAAADTVDPTLEATCLKAMAREPSARYPTARALGDEVEKWLASDYRKLKEAHKELKKAEAALRMSEARYRQLTEGCLDAVVVVDEMERITLFNPAAEKTFGYEASEILGEPLDRIMPVVLGDPGSGRSPEETNCPLPRVVGKTVELRGRRKGGEEFPLELSLNAVHLAGELQYIGSIRDQTERQQMRAMLAQSEKLASIGMLVAGVVHEIQNPLAFVANNLNVLARDVDAIINLVTLYEESHDLLADARPELSARITELRDHDDLDHLLPHVQGVIGRSLDGLRRIKEIIRDLREFARVEDSASNTFDLNGGIESAVAIIAGRARKKGVELLTDLEPLPPLTCVAAKINNVIMNLLANGIDACTEGGTVTVRSRPEGRGIRIEVVDTGVGIDPAILDRIFDPFFTTKPANEGSGLGLSICAGIIKDHGGSIEVASEVGRGSRFRVVLPREKQ
jgi:PAS domain S-box-containing protein